MKKTFLAIMTIATVAMLTACGNTETVSTTTSEVKTETVASVEVEPEIEVVPEIVKITETELRNVILETGEARIDGHNVVYTVANDETYPETVESEDIVISDDKVTLTIPMEKGKMYNFGNTVTYKYASATEGLTADVVGDVSYFLCYDENTDSDKVITRVEYSSYSALYNGTEIVSHVVPGDDLWNCDPELYITYYPEGFKFDKTFCTDVFWNFTDETPADYDSDGMISVGEKSLHLYIDSEGVEMNSEYCNSVEELIDIWLSCDVDRRCGAHTVWIPYTESFDVAENLDASLYTDEDGTFVTFDKVEDISGIEYLLFVE